MRAAPTQFDWGHRPSTPDSLPVLGELRRPGLYLVLAMGISE
jgi:glycine/D-amino acid oxidase-like deaminating enzyme